MSGPSWTDIVGGLGGGIGGATGVAAFVVAILAKRDSRRSADASVRSADAADRSAGEAAKLNRIEQERREAEREQRHDELAPQVPGEIITELRDGRATESLFGSITLTRAYRVQADAIFHSGGKSSLGLSLLHPHQQTWFEIEKWPTGSTRPKVEAVKFRFWPPCEADQTDAWSCPCGRPTGETLSGPGHWEFTVRVAAPPVEPWAALG